MHIQIGSNTCPCSASSVNSFTSAQQISSFHPDSYDVYKEPLRLKKISNLSKSILKKYYGYSHLKTNWFPNDVPRHIYFFSEKNLRELGNICGLKVQKIKTRTSVKFILNSLDYVTMNKGTLSKKIRWKRLLARAYVLLAQYKKQGDEIFAVFTKP